ncbi:viroplasmin family protein [Phocicoccus pinnipedialis]|uniref:Ribonuclease H n=1 Tax=Phocicoccus pinnipedialis TaxID=110845 RepID=A0A6V7RCW2_9BACL|nr:ribonuclease H family protein [Jeotgalicoccus pinnipedialis]MBP1939895.1 ribonuclease HI [Jeotgalicoccus pinnipedialis]CAD2074762.1 Ribonuclease H [Jeotgalicoccus pinnipedialis]
MSKFYAVRKGRTPGIYTTWPDAQREVTGFKGAEFKSFKSKKEAEGFMNDAKNEIILDGLIAYVDGSYDKRTKRAGFGAVLIDNNEVIKEATLRTEIDPEDNLWNVTAEIEGVLFAVNYAIDHGYDKVHVHYDYAGLEKWANKEWRANKKTTKRYQDMMQDLMKKVHVDFIKVAAHTGDFYNERADDLAKQAIFGGTN